MWIVGRIIGALALIGAIYLLLIFATQKKVTLICDGKTTRKNEDGSVSKDVAISRLGIRFTFYGPFVWGTEKEWTFEKEKYKFRSKGDVEFTYLADRSDSASAQYEFWKYLSSTDILTQAYSGIGDNDPFNTSQILYEAQTNTIEYLHKNGQYADYWFDGICTKTRPLI